MKRAAVLLVLAIVAALVPFHSAQALGEQLEIVFDGTVTRKVPVLVPATDTTAREEMTLRMQGDGPPVQIRSLSAAVPKVTITPHLVGSATPAVLRPGSPFTIVVDIVGLETSGTYPGALSAAIGSPGGKPEDDVVVELTGLEIFKPVRAQVTISGTQADGLKRTTTEENPRFEFDLTNETSGDLTGVSARASSLNGPRGPVNVAAVANPSTIPRGGAAKLTLTMALPDIGEYTDSSITVLVGAQPQAPVALKVSRTKLDGLELAGIANGGFTFTAADRSATYRIDVVNTTAADVTDVAVQVSDLVGPGGVVVTPVVTFGGEKPTNRPVAKGSAVPIAITAAALDRAGDYTSSIRVSVAGVITDLASLKITRDVSALPVQLTAPGPFRATVSVARTTEVGVEVKAIEETGVRRSLSVGVALRRSDPNSAEQIKGVELKPTGSKDCTAKATVEVDGRNPQTFTGSLCDVPVPGQYTATLSFADGSRTEKTIDVQLFVRRAGWLAIVIMALGVIASAFLTAQQDRRDKAKRRYRLRWIETQIRGVTATGAAAEDVVPDLQDRLRRLVEEVERSEPGVDDRVSSLQRQVALLRPYVETRARAVANNASVPSVLDSVRIALRSEAMSDADATKAREDLDLAWKIIEAKRSIGPAVQSLEQAVDRWAQEAAPGEAALKTVNDQLERARHEMDEGKQATAQEAWTEAARALAKGLAKSLQDAAAEQGPEWLEQAADPRPLAKARDQASSAADAIDEAGVESDPADLLDRFVQAAGFLLAVQADILAEVATAAEKQAGVPAPAKAKLRRATSAAKRAATHARKGQLQEASGLFKMAVSLYDGAVPSQQPETADTDRVTVPSSVTSFATPMSPQPTAPAPLIVPRDPPIDYVLEALLFALTVVAAVLVGYPTQYAANSAWGSVGDMFGAFIWGLGLSGATYQGFRPLRKKLSEQAV